MDYKPNKDRIMKKIHLLYLLLILFINCKNKEVGKIERLLGFDLPKSNTNSNSSENSLTGEGFDYSVLNFDKQNFDYLLKSKSMFK